jgi:predicted DNA-binding transcriptional regulator YafY
MKFRSQFLAALASLAVFPFRRFARRLHSSGTTPHAAGTSGRGARRGPWLADWRLAPWVPVHESVHPTAQRLILATLRHEMLPVRYWSGSTPDQARAVSPGLVFQLGGRGPLYVSGYCHLRRAERVFRVDCLEISAPEDWRICITE